MNEIVSIDYSPYTLNSANSFNAKTFHSYRYGALLKVQFIDQIVGYADLCPLIEFLDPDISSQIHLYKQKKTPSLFTRSLYFARLDAESRLKNRSIFQEFSEFPRNHILFQQLPTEEKLLKKIKQDTILCSNDFQYIKLKFGRSFSQELEFLKKNSPFLIENRFKLRIDFNGSLSEPKYWSFLNDLLPYSSVIDFIEDPFSQVAESEFNYLRKFSKDLNFAADFCTLERNDYYSIFSYKIIKPAREDFRDFLYLNIPLVFTHSMDHPFGHLCALYDSCCYSALYKKETLYYGLLGLNVYEKNVFSEKLSTRNQILYPLMNETGFGFENELNNLEWYDCGSY